MLLILTLDGIRTANGEEIRLRTNDVACRALVRRIATERQQYWTDRIFDANHTLASAWFRGTHSTDSGVSWHDVEPGQGSRREGGGTDCKRSATHSARGVSIMSWC